VVGEGRREEKFLGKHGYNVRILKCSSMNKKRSKRNIPMAEKRDGLKFERKVKASQSANWKLLGRN